MWVLKPTQLSESQEWVISDCLNKFHLSYLLDKVTPSSIFIFIFIFLQQANLIGSLLKKNETMEAPQDKRFYFEV